jgi:hypothetical protein
VPSVVLGQQCTLGVFKFPGLYPLGVSKFPGLGSLWVHMIKVDPVGCVSRNPNLVLTNLT